MPSHLQASLDGRCMQAFELVSDGRAGEAEAVFRQVLTLEPGNVLALEGLGLCAEARGDWAAAEAAFERALALVPGRIEPAVGLAALLARRNERTRAAALLDGVLDREPTHAKALFLRADLLLMEGDFTAVRQRFRRGASKDPVIAAMIDSWIAGHGAHCDWRGWDELVRYLKDGVEAGRDVCEPFNMMTISSSPAELLKSTRVHAARRFPARPPLWRGGPRREGRIRIAYLSADFRNHPVAHLFAGLLERHDRSAFEVTAISYGPASDDPVRKRIEAGFEHFVDVEGRPADEIAAIIHERDIDIAVTMNGYTTLSRPEILAWRPARLQVNFQGFPGTMAAPYIDYLVADLHTIPVAEARFYTEKIVWMPDTYQPPDNLPLPQFTDLDRASEGLPEGRFVFMNFNKAAKINPATFDVWMRILNQVEGSVLWLAPANDVVKTLLGREAEARGVNAERLIFAAFEVSRERHLARFALGDLFLDTLPYNAHSIASECLWAGTPLLTCRGTAFAGRVCAGLLSVADLPELITNDHGDFENQAVALAKDPARLAALRRKIAGPVRASPLFDPERYARNLETAFATMHERAMSGKPPRSFQVADQAVAQKGGYAPART